MEQIIIEATIQSKVDKVWKYWTEPDHITQWNNASDDWHTPHATNDLRVGGKFLSRMEARDGSFGFDFEGIYDEVKDKSIISYGLEDGRKVRTVFESIGDATKVTTSFDPEQENSIELQKGGWQAILDNFKKHVETN